MSVEPDPIPWSGETNTPPAVTWAGGVGVVPPAPAPPLDDQDWYDPQLTFEAVLNTLRLTEDDVDADAILYAITAAASTINQFLDRVDPLPSPTPAPVQLALEQLSIELYRRKDAPFNLLNATVPEDVPVDITGIGSIQSVAPLLQPYKQRWGFA